MRLAFLSALLGCPFLVAPCFGARVIEVLDSGRKLSVGLEGATWKQGAVVCVVRDSKRIACGTVFELRQARAVVSLDFRNTTPIVGDTVVSAVEARAFQNATRQLASGPAVGKGKVAPAGGEVDPGIEFGPNIQLKSPRRRSEMFSADLNGDFDLLNFGASFDGFLAPRVSYALQFASYDSTDQFPHIKGYSFFVTRYFRPSREFSGIFMGVGIGGFLYQIGSGGTVANKPGIGLKLALGWSYRVTSWFVLSPSIGALALSSPKTDGVDIGTFYHLRPWFGLSAGVPF